MKRTQGIVRIISLVGLNFSLTKIHVIFCVPLFIYSYHISFVPT